MNVVTTYRSPNYDSRPAGVVIDSIVLHTTEGTFPSDRDWLCSPASRVSAHYLIAPDCTVYELVSPTQRARHAGVAMYAGRRDWNSPSVGIEISSAPGGTPTQAQKDTAAALCRQLIATYPIRQPYIVAHAWIAMPPGRRHDPSGWNGDDLRAWIAGLFVTQDPWFGWGNRFPLPPEQRGWAIPQEWLKRPAQFGAAVSEEKYETPTMSVRVFERGAILYNKITNRAYPVLF